MSRGREVNSHEEACMSLPRMINCFSASSLPLETSSSIESHNPLESASLVPGFLLVGPRLDACPSGKDSLCMVAVIPCEAWE